MQTNGEAVERILDAAGGVLRALRKQPMADADHAAFWVLTSLVPADLRTTQLAQVTLLDASTVSRHVDALQAKGLVERKPDPADGRARLVALTDQGREAVNRAKSRRRTIIVDELARWDRADVDTLAALLSRLAENLTTTLRQEGPRA